MITETRREALRVFYVEISRLRDLLASGQNLCHSYTGGKAAYTCNMILLGQIVTMMRSFGIDGKKTWPEAYRDNEILRSTSLDRLARDLRAMQGPCWHDAASSAEHPCTVWDLLDGQVETTLLETPDFNRRVLILMGGETGLNTHRPWDFFGKTL